MVRIRILGNKLLGNVTSSKKMFIGKVGQLSVNNYIGMNDSGRDNMW